MRRLLLLPVPIALIYLLFQPWPLSWVYPQIAGYFYRRRCGVGILTSCPSEANLIYFGTWGAFVVLIYAAMIAAYFGVRRVRAGLGLDA